MISEAEKTVSKNKKLKILLIDDDRMSLDMMAIVLKMHGYNCTSFISSKDGINEYYMNDYDLIVADYNMPGLNGIDVLKNIKKYSNDAKVIIYSGVADSSVRSIAKDYGVYEFFFKPIDWLYFAEKLVELETEKDYIS